MQQEWFTSWFNTKYYYELYQNRDHKDAHHFLNSLISFLQPPSGSKMLDLACGKGRHAQYLSSLGFDVTGVDISLKSIEEAVLQETDTLHFFKHDMRNPFWIHYFDYVFNFFTSFGYFNTERENNQVIKSINQGLKKGGIFVLDYLNVIFTERHLIPKESIVINNNHYNIARNITERFIIKTINIEDNNIGAKFSFEEKVSRFTLPDFEALLLNNNFQIKSIFGDYELNSYKELASPRLIIVAEKK